MYRVSVDGNDPITRLVPDGVVGAFKIFNNGLDLVYASAEDNAWDVSRLAISNPTPPLSLTRLPANTGFAVKFVVSADSKNALLGPETALSPGNLWRVNLESPSSWEVVESQSITNRLAQNFSAAPDRALFYYTAVGLSDNITHLYRIASAGESVFTSSFETLTDP